MDRVNNIIAKKNYFKAIQASYVCHEAKKIIKELTGEDVKIISSKNKILKISAYNNYAASEIRSQKMTAIELINKKIGSEAVKNIRVC